jgi:hypothetical protein
MLVTAVSFVKTAARAPSYLWASPNTVVGLAAAAAALLDGALVCGADQAIHERRVCARFNGSLTAA